MSHAHLIKPLPNARSWAVALAGAPIPVLRPTLERLAELAAQEETVSAHELSEAVMGDPLMTARLFARLAEGPTRGRTSHVGSVTTAIVMIGVPPFFRAFADLVSVNDYLRDEPRAQQGLLKVVRRAIRAAEYARDWAVQRQDIENETIMMAALLHDVAEMLLWCAAPAMATEVRERLAASPGLRSADAQRAVLHATVEEIQAELMKRLRLPALLVAMNDPGEARNPQVRTVALAVRLARHSALTWDDPALPDDYNDIAELLRVSPQRVMEMILPRQAAA